MDCPYTLIINTAMVETKAAISKLAVVRSPRDKDWNKAGKAPAAISGLVGEGKKLKARIKICWATPPAINKLIPEPKPHLLTTSSMNMMINPPKNNWTINTSSNSRYKGVPCKAAEGANPPMSTYTDASKMIKKMANNFCRPWNRLRPSVWERSNFRIPVPVSSCKTMEAVTMGPIPKETMLPNDAPRMIDRNSNCCKAFSPSPNKGTKPMMKNNTRIIKVHLSFSLKGSFLCSGARTSGRLEMRVSKKDIVLQVHAEDLPTCFFNFLFSLRTPGSNGNF